MGKSEFSTIFDSIFCFQAGRKSFKKDILPRIQDLLPTNWQANEDGTKSIFLLSSLANLYPVEFLNSIKILSFFVSF